MRIKKNITTYKYFDITESDILRKYVKLSQLTLSPFIPFSPFGPCENKNSKTLLTKLHMTSTPKENNQC